MLTGRLRDSGHLEKGLKRYAINIIWDAANPDNGYIYAKRQYQEVFQHIDGRYAAEWMDRAVNENPQKYVYLVTLVIRREIAKHVR